MKTKILTGLGINNFKAFVTFTAGMIILAATLMSAMAFTPYDCNNTANVYDNFEDDNINYALWKIGSYDTVEERDGVLHVYHHVTGSPSIIIYTNETVRENEVKYGFIGSGGCVKLITKSNGGGGTNEIKFTIAGNTISLDPVVAKVNATAEAWRDNNIIYYRLNTSFNDTATLYNASVGEYEIWDISVWRQCQGNPCGVALNISDSYLNQTGMLNLRIYDETTEELLTENVTITKTESDVVSTSTTTGQKVFSDFDGNTTIYLLSTDYYPRHYIVEHTNYDVVNLETYLLNTSQTNAQEVTLTVAHGTDVLEGVTFQIYRNFGGVFKEIYSHKTDISGKVTLYLDKTMIYSFNLSKPGYKDKSFELYPTSTAYTIYMQATTGFFNDTAQDIIYSISPQNSVVQTNESTNFSINTTSPDGNIENFGLWTDFNGSTTITNLTSSTGGNAIISLNTTGYENTTLMINYFIESDAGVWNTNRTYQLRNYQYGSNASVMGIFQDVAGDIDPIYKFLFAITVSLIVGAGFFVLLGAAGASFIAWIVFMIFGVVGFVSWVFPTLAGILLVLGYVVVGGNTGT